MSDRTHAAVVLAAGGSRRLGRPKQLLQRDAETLVHRAVRLARATSPRRLLVVMGAYREEIDAALRDLACEHVDNPEWPLGISSSLRVALDALQGHAGPILILGCDQPALELSHLQRLLHGAARVAPGCAATAHDDSLGIPAVVSLELLRESRMLRGDAGLRARLNAISPEQVATLDAPELRFDLDTPDDVLTAIARGLIDADEQP